jgi:hypothetical protein
MHRFNTDKVDTSDFDYRDITIDELYGMLDCAKATLEKPRKDTTRHEHKLAQYLLKAYKWIEREAYLTLRKEQLKEQLRILDRRNNDSILTYGK